MADSDIDKEKWLDIMSKLKQKQIIPADDPEKDILSYPLRIGGADLSYLPGDDTKAVCCYVVLEYQYESQIYPTVLRKDLKYTNLGEFPNSHFAISILTFGNFQPFRICQVV